MHPQTVSTETGTLAEPTAAASRPITDRHPASTPTPAQPRYGWPGSLSAVAGVYAVLTFNGVKLGTTRASAIVADLIGGAIMRFTAAYLRTTRLGTLALSPVLAIP